MIVGIDLAAKKENKTGIAILEDKKVEVDEVHFDEEILDRSGEAHLIVFDAPLSLPMGRCCLERDCECSKFGHFRKSDLEIRKYGSVLPLTFPYMKKLTFRAIKLKNILKSINQEGLIIETHPTTAIKLMGDNLNLGDLSGHEFDALVAALTGYLYLKKECIILGDPREGTIVLPKPNRSYDSSLILFKIFSLRKSGDMNLG